MNNKILSIKQNFVLNCPDFDIESNDWINAIIEKVCELNYEDFVCTYSKYDNSLDFVFYCKHEYLLHLSVFSDDINNAVFSIYHNKELLVADVLNLDELIETFKNIMSKYDG